MGDDHRLELVMELIREVIHDAEKAAEQRMLEKVLAAAEKLENTVAIEKVQIMTAPRIAASEGG